MIKHTPGPWVIEENPTIPEKLQIAAFSSMGNRELQIIVRSNNVDDDMNFIASAPETAAERDRLKEINSELLEALEELLQLIEIERPDWQHTEQHLARAAIAKATGEQQ